MSSLNFQGKKELRTILASFCAWLFSALILLIIGSIIVNKANVKSSVLGYISSAISFLSAFSAGAAAVKARGQASLLYGLFESLLLIIVLLFFGVIVSGSKISPYGILSIVMFTIAGCLSAAVLTSLRKSKAKIKRRQNLHKSGYIKKQ